uniref:Hemolymph juvenile hormone binding protein n=1 Tax=Coptotermes formosanus TaxID=36987 RepID=R4ULX4_COPFO|nr:hemolymph juvenile hormone binding protein [Coptotermes formosanus]
MKAVHGVILVLVLLLGANALPKPRQINRQVLEARLRKLSAPGFRSELDDNLRRFIDTVVRDVIINGRPELGLPVLDPLEVEHLDFDIALESVKAKGSVDKVVIRGASKFVVESVKTDPDNLRAEVDISLAEARVEAEHYKLEGDLLNGALPLEGEGRLEADLRELRLKVIVELGVREDESVEVRLLELDVSLGQADVKLENLLGGGDLGEIANGLISSALPDLVESEKGSVLPQIADAIKSLVNEQLVGKSLDDILDLINNFK